MFLGRYTLSGESGAKKLPDSTSSSQVFLTSPHGPFFQPGCLVRATALHSAVFAHHMPWIRTTISSPFHPVGLWDPFADKSIPSKSLHDKERGSFCQGPRSPPTVPTPNTHTQSPPTSFPKEHECFASQNVCSMLAAGFSSQRRAASFSPTHLQLYMTRSPVLVFKNSKQHKTKHCP